MLVRERESGCRKADTAVSAGQCDSSKRLIRNKGRILAVGSSDPLAPVDRIVSYLHKSITSSTAAKRKKRTTQDQKCLDS